MLMDSAPPAKMMWALPALILSAAMAIAWRPELQKRFMVTPVVVSGSPALGRLLWPCCFRILLRAWRSLRLRLLCLPGGLGGIGPGGPGLRLPPGRLAW